MESKKTKKRKKLSFLESIFIEAYTGNAAETAEFMTAQGISITAGTCSKMSNRPHVIEEIRRREEEGKFPGPERKELIANRQERQIFWTQIMMDSEAQLKDRLKASELLGRSACDFSDKLVHEGGTDLTIRWDDEQAERLSFFD